MNQIVYHVFLVYMTFHIAVLLLLDLQGLYGQYYPKLLQEWVYQRYVSNFSDPLMKNPPSWFQAILFEELVFQLPLAILIMYGLMNKRYWVRLPCIIFGTHVVSQVSLIIYEFCKSISVSYAQKTWLIAIYLPVFIFPTVMAFYMTMNVQVFEDPAIKRKRG